MNLKELVSSHHWKVFMGYVYGFGAALVIIGALFKLQHWPGAGVFLAIGLLTEAFIFFMSAFEPPLEQPNWSRVYPELLDEHAQQNTQPRNPQNLNGLLQQAHITPEMLENLSNGLANLTEASNQISKITNASLATDAYIQNINSAAKTIQQFTQLNEKANQTIDQSITNFVGAYMQTAQNISSSTENLFKGLNTVSETFSSNLQKVNNQLSGLSEQTNSSIEQRLNNISLQTSKYEQNLQKLNDTIEQLNSRLSAHTPEGAHEISNLDSQVENGILSLNNSLAGSIATIQQYQVQAEKLNKNLEALNAVYGNMLTAMNYKAN